MSAQLKLGVSGQLWFGDNLEVLRLHVDDESVDLIYLDPPFNSDRSYNRIFRRSDGTEAPSQVKAFDDTWRWDMGAAATYEDVIRGGGDLSRTLAGFRSMLGPSDMLAYLTMMAPRLVELKRVLKSTGSAYLHCDPTASHYLKILMDSVFGAENFLNNVVWLYGLGGSSSRYWPKKHDDLLWYSRLPDKHYFEPDMIPATSNMMKGQLKKAPDYWDIPSINNMAKERLGYPTQKPLALLERVVRSSCPRDGVVLDPFCGCGTTIDAAQTLGRRWIGVDITKIAIEIIRERLQDRHGLLDIELHGEPTTLDDAEALSELDKYEFEAWVCRRLGAKHSKKKGADRGIDGELIDVFDNGETWRGIVSVKGGGVNVAQLRDLNGTVLREKADFGVFATLRPPSRPMRQEAATAGFTPDQVPKLQIVTIADLLEGRGPELPARSARLATKPAVSSRRLRAV